MARNKHTWQAKLTQAEKDAAIRARVVHDMNSAEVARRAAAGELEGAGKFSITAAYVRKLAQQHQASVRPDKLAQPGEAEKAIEQARLGVLSMILRDHQRLMSDAKRGELDTARATRIIRALHDWQRTANASPGKRDNAQTQDASTEMQDGAAQVIAQLAALAQTRANGATNGASLLRDVSS